MKPSVLLINCYKDAKDERVSGYQEWLTPHFKLTTVHVDAMTSHEVTEDAIVVSGSQRQLATDPVPEVLTKLYLETQKPLLGICYGHQTLAAAWGAKVIKKKLLKKDETIRVIKTEDLLYHMGLFFVARESHYEHVVRDAKLKRHFEVLAYSDSCKVEIVRHKERPMWGVQFHPERSGSSGRQLAANFAQIVPP